MTASTAATVERQSIGLCIGGNLFLRLGNSATGALMGLVLASINRERGDVPAIAVGLLAASFYLAELVGAPICGAASDRYGRRVFMIAGPICGAVAVQLIGWPTLLLGWPLLLVAMGAGRVIEGLSTACSAPSTLSFLSAATENQPTFRGRVMSWYEMATVVGIGGGFVSAGLVWDELGHGAILAVTAIYGLSMLLFLYVRDPGGAVDRHEPTFHALLTVLRQPKVFRFIPAWLAINTVVGVWFVHSAFLLTGVRQPGQALPGSFTGTSLAAVFALFSVTFMVGVLVWGYALGTHRKTNIMLLALIGIYLIGVSLAGLNHQVGAGSAHMILVGLFFGGVLVASGFTPAALAYLADLSEERAEHRGAVMGLYSVTLGLGQLLGGTLGGAFAGWASVNGLILLTILLGSIALLTVLGLHRFEDRARII